MSGGKYFLPMIAACLFAIQHLSAYTEDFESAKYESNVPAGWALKEKGTACATVSSPQPCTPSASEESGLGINFYSATKGNLLYRTAKINDSLVCDTILAKLRIYVTPKNEKVDAFQIVVSTNAWASYEAVGAPIAIEDDRETAGWETFSRRLTLKGLAQANPDLYVGILLIPASKSHDTGYIRSIELNTVAAAAPTGLCLKREGVAVGDLTPGEDKVALSVCVTPDPQDDRLTLEGVYGVVTRNGVASTNKLTRVEGTDEYVGPILEPALDAGETVVLSAYSRYNSTLPTAGILHDDDDYTYEEAEPPVSYSVGKRGSVWINELSADRLEIGGTTNRVMSSGWTLVVSDDEGVVCRAELGEAFDFTTNMINGVVGLDVRDLVWREGALPTDRSVSVSLCNSQGIAEHTVKMLFAAGSSRGFTGYAPWPEAGFSYDWTGLATSGVFTWGDLTETSFGAANAGQGFNVPVSVTLTVNTTNGSGEDAVPISHATVIATVTDFTNAATAGTTKDFTAVSEDGVAVFALEGWAPFTNEIRVALSGSAFGWACVEKKNVVLAKDSSQTVPLAFVPTVASDDFTELSGYWSNLGKLEWEVASASDGKGTRSVLQVNTYSVTIGQGLLKCGNYLSAHGRRLCSIGFDYRNTVDKTNDSHDDFSVLISTNANFEGTVLSSPALSNKRSEYGDDEWYHYQSVLELPSEFSDAPEIWIELLCVSQFKTHTYTYVDNLRIAFQDVAMPMGLTRTIAAPVSGEMPAFALNVVPQTSTNGTVKEVSADLHLIVNGVTNIVPFAFADGTLTNDLAVLDGETASVPMTLSAADLTKALGGPLMTGDAVSYFAAVHYNSANGDTDPAKVYETRYFPDNATTSNINETAYWIVEGAYGVNTNLNAQSFVVTGDALSCVGAPVVTTEGVTFTLHGYAEAGLSSLTVNVNGKDYAPFEGLDTNAQTRVTGAFSLPTGLAANTDYTVTISAQDANGAALQPATFTFTTLPKVTGAKIEGVSTNEVKLTVSGAAAGYVVPSGWTPQGANTWTRSDGTPNAKFEATVYGTNKLGQASATVSATPGHTHAAVATRAPVIVKNVTTVTVRADASASASDDGNPAETEYAIRVTTSAGATNDVAVWKTLADWRDAAETIASPILDLEAENTFSFITRNFDGYVTTNESPVTVSCSFPLTAAFDGEKAEQKTDGTVALALDFFDPAGSDGAKAEVMYRLGEGEWQKVCESFDVVFENLAATNALAWDAWTAVGKTAGEYPYGLRARVVSGNRTSEWTEVTGTLDFAPPANLTVSGTPASGAVTAERAYSLTLSAQDSHAVTYSWTLDGAIGTGATVSGSFAQDGKHTLVATATDALGNTSDSVTYSWTLDTTAPTVELTSETPQLFNGSQTFTLTATFSEAVTGFTKESVSVENGTVTDVTAAKDAENTYVITITPTADGEVSVQIALGVVADAAGNENEASTTVTRTFDTTAPTVTLASATSARFNGDQTFTVTATFSEAVTGFAVGSVSVENGKVDDVTAAEDAEDTYVITITPTADGAVSVQIAAGAVTDTAGNGNEASSRLTRTYDTTAPTVVLASETPEAFNAEKAPLVVMATFSEGVTGFATDAVTVQNGTVNEVEKVENAEAEDETETYRVTITPAADGEVVVQIAAGVVTDAAGNGNVASATLTRTYDTTAPTVTLSADTTTGFFNTETLVVTATFSEPVTNFLTATDAIRIENGTASDVREVADAENAYAVTITPTDEGAVSVQVKAGVVADAAENVNEASETATYTYDKTPPTKPELSGAPSAVTRETAVSLTAAATDANAITYHWTFNGVESTGASLAGTAQEGANTVSVYAEDAAGNKSETTTRSWTLDTTAPTVELASETPQLFNGSQTFTLTATFSEGVTNFTAESVSVQNGTVYDVEKVENAEAEDKTATYRITITPTADGEVSVQIAAGVVADAAGNVNEASTTVTRTFDTTEPTVELTSATSARFNARQAFTVTATFSEDVTELTKALVSVENGSVADVTAVAGAKNAYTLTITPTAEGDVSVWIAAGVVADAAGNGNVASERLTRTYDTTAPTVTLAGVGDEKTLYNAKDVFTVRVTFSEAVTNFTADAVTVKNGAVAEVKESEDAANTYLVTVTPAADGEVSVQIAAGVVADAAGNGNEASATLTRTYDITPPTVTLTASIEADEILDESNNKLEVTVAFSEPVENFTSNSVTVVNCTVNTEPKAEGNAYSFTVVPIQSGKFSVQIAAGAVTDKAGNGNVASEVLTRIYDTDPPTKPVISGTPANGATVNTKTFSLSAAATDATSNVKVYRWFVNGTQVQVIGIGKNTLTSEKYESLIQEGVNTVTVMVRDETANNWSALSDAYTWTYESGETSGDVEFGDDVCVKVDSETGKTNDVSFTAVDFKPGETSTFTLTGFDASAQEITNLQMWMVVGETLGGASWHVPVDAKAQFDSATGALTVTLPASATLKTEGGEPYDTFFIFGIDNKNSSND